MTKKNFVTAIGIAVLLLTMALSAFAQEARASRNLNDPAEVQRQLAAAVEFFQARDARFASVSASLSVANFAAPTVQLIVQGGTRLASDATFVSAGQTVRLTCQRTGAACTVVGWDPDNGLRVLADDLGGFLDLAPKKPTSVAAFTLAPDGSFAVATLLLQTPTKDGTIAVCDGATIARVGQAITLYPEHNLASPAEWILPTGAMPESQVGYGFNTQVFSTGFKAYIAAGHQDNRAASCACIVYGLAPLRTIPVRQQ